MNKKYIWLVIIFLTVASMAAFGRIAGNDFVNYDDNVYITENHKIQSGINLQSIQWAFGAVEESNWHPLTWISHMMDWELFGANASGHHIVSLVLHIAVVVLLFLFLCRTTNNIWSAAFATAFFAVHPLRVESVAWAAERKDVLSMFFGMATLYAYSFYAETKKLSYYFVCFMLFSCALMSKPMFVTLPFLLMLLDYWPLKRWQNMMTVSAETRFQPMGGLIWEKLPFLCMTMASSVMTYWAQKKGNSITSIEILPFYERFTNGVLSYMLYLGKIFCPSDLAVFYPYKLSLPVWQIFVAGLMIGIMTVAVFYLIRTMPFLFTGWFWYLGTLIPVIGLIQVGEQSLADRYTYLPSIGISIMMAWGLPPVLKRIGLGKNVLFLMSMGILSILVFSTWMQSGYWKNSITLFNHALQVTNKNYIVHNNLGYTFLGEGKTVMAIYHFDQAISVKRNYSVAYYNRGNAYAKMGHYQRAIQDYNEAIRIKPDYVDAYNNRSVAYLKLGEYQLAINDLNKAINVMPLSAHAYHNRGVIYDKLGNYRQAIKDYNEAIRRKPDLSDAYYNRGIIYGQHGDYMLAIDDFNKVINLNPHGAEAYNNRGFTYVQLGRYQSAIDDYTQAISKKPDYTEAYMNRGVAYFRWGRNDMGCRDVRKACSLGNCTTLESVRVVGLCR